MREPKSNQVTHICTLKTGDRFFIANDKAKNVWQLRYHTMVRVNGVFKKYSVCKQDNGTVNRFDANRVIVFLRRTIPDLPERKKDFMIEKYFA